MKAVKTSVSTSRLALLLLLVLGLFPLAGGVWTARAEAQVPQETQPDFQQTDRPQTDPNNPDYTVPPSAPSNTRVGQPTNRTTDSGQQGRSRDMTMQGQSSTQRTPRDLQDETRSLMLPAIEDPPTEFQELVRSSTGRRVPIFGASLFSRVPTTFAPVENAPVTPDYVIGPGDELRIQVWGQLNQQGDFTVDRTGAISIPALGTVHVAGLRFSELTEFLRRQFGRVYRNFDLNVNMGQLRSIQVFVVGKARRPGSYTIGSLSTLLNALFASGGPLPQGSLRDIQLRRGTETVVHFDLYDLLLRGDKSKDVTLQSGDVIFIPPVSAQAALIGSVGTPAIYELRGETSVQQLIELAGGFTSVAAASSVRLERISQHAMRSVVEVELPKASATQLESGDVVVVNSIVDRFKDAVTLRGNVANPGRYAWHAGMRVRDLIPTKESLITRNYWDKRNQLGLVLPELPERRPLTTSNQQVTQGTQITPGLLSDRQRARDTESETPSPGSQSRGGSVGAALSAGNEVFAPKTDVSLSAPDIDWSYAVIERQSQKDLSTSLLPFHLGRAVLEGDASQNLELLPGDVVTIFSTADIRVPTTQQTRFVRLEGEFVAAGVYSVQPGETLRQLLTRAGGLTPDAYLYASSFTRESTRRVERQRLSEYADQLEAQAAAATSGASARAVSDRDVAASQASAEEARAAIARLRRVQPQGRIVLDLKPDSRGLDSIPDLALEDGDRFVVPKVPSNVSVEGQVYNPNAFVFNRGRRMIDYLHQAGGPDRQADKRRAFILRADGSVFSDQYGNVKHANIFPGDTIVVPPMINRRSVLRTIVDVSAVIGQVGVGIAAINLLR